MDSVKFLDALGDFPDSRTSDYNKALMSLWNGEFVELWTQSRLNIQFLMTEIRRLLHYQGAPVDNESRQTDGTTLEENSQMLIRDVQEPIIRPMLW